MKLIKRLLISLVVIILLAVTGLYITGNGHIVNGLPSTYLSGNSKPDIDDMSFHDVRAVKAGEPMPWNESLLAENALTSEDIDYMDELETTAFLVIKSDEIIYERYAMGYDESTLSNSFSMAKSFASLCIGTASDRGLIRETEKVAKYLPRFAQDEQDKRLTIRQVLQMRSNIDFGESYGDPFGYMAKAYFGDDLLELTEPFHVSGYPGTLWKYEGGNTVILSEILTKATNKNLSEWFSATVWSQIGAENDAYWNLDKEDGTEKAFSGFYATARDFARVGKLMRDRGKWDGRKIVGFDWVESSITPVHVANAEGDVVEHYGYQWWLAPQDNEPWHFSARGMRGQYIIAVPSEDLVIVRLGHNRVESEANATMSPDLSRWVDLGLKLKEKHAERH
ncbi:MAG: beta-lactamase family protein [Flavobacteriales bacterium]|nr:beta-lactamase family protein [Flavobacteriales bacterium]